MRLHDGIQSAFAMAAGLLALLSSSCGRSGSPTLPPSSTPAATPAPGQTRLDGRGIEQVWVPPGSFQMGSDAASIEGLLTLDPPAFVRGEFPSEQPQHEVRISRGFWIDKYEVTVAAFQAFADDGGYRNRALWSEAGWEWLGGQQVEGLPRPCNGYGPQYPRLCVTWFEAQAYASWRGGRLPTEAEWEYAARGPQSAAYPWGDEWDAGRCNVLQSPGPMPVGSFPGGASWIGAQDMAGNAMEWVQDWLDVDYYAQGPMTDPTGPADGRIKVEKGGWWGSNPFVARSAYRHFEDPPTYNDPHIGFRVVSP